MQQALQLAALAILTALLIRMQQGKEYGILLALAACAAAGVVLARVVQPLLTFVRELGEQTGLQPALLSPLWKVVGITLISRLSGAVCDDAGQKTLGELVRQGGEVLALCAALPLMRAVLALLSALSGGNG